MGKRVRISNDSLNSYGFRVLTHGMDVAQYNRNPVLLYMHERGNVGSIQKHSQTSVHRLPHCSPPSSPSHSPPRCHARAYRAARGYGCTEPRPSRSSALWTRSCSGCHWIFLLVFPFALVYEFISLRVHEVIVFKQQVYLLVYLSPCQLVYYLLFSTAILSDKSLTSKKV